ncbi:PREDICTED: BAHD acyltransferase At3g29680 [Camelina sativa]|uniref:BAHD acyltransferase At3g29680 n=1 Tax=Camelina sativa TaxID=90675 RepID=A0ABM0TFS2_CAMSA|nr:PREDICTED: BAHD acyltransferase At3g29680 [Camelina sativa]
MALNVIKISRVSPVTSSTTPLLLPLTFFDLLWLKLSPIERVTFYKLTELSYVSFFSSILPKLELSLSLAISHFLPLSGHLKWNPQDPKPRVFVFSQDTVSLTVAETDADFSRVSSKEIRLETELRSFIPKLEVSSESTSLFSLQVTLFPNQGFTIGITTHHVIMDGKTATKFHNSWAHICKYGTIPQDLDLPLVLDRTVINVPTGLEFKMLQLLPYLSKDRDNARTLKVPPAKDIKDVVWFTLQLSQENIEKLKERAKNESIRSDLYLSTFVVTYAYVLTCVVKARGGSVDRPVRFMYAADFKNRLVPPVPLTYFGNCVLPIDFYGYKAKTFLGDDGFVNGVEILSDSVKGLGLRSVESIWDVYEEGTKTMELGTQVLTVTGSNQFGIYGLDFGWGRPIHTEIMSLYKNDEFSMSARRDEIGGVEIGVCLKKSEMDVFKCRFWGEMDLAMMSKL